MSSSGPEDLIRFFADEELAGTVEDKFTAVGLDVATILFFFLLFLHPLHLFGARRAEMADVEQMKKIIPFVTCEITFGQNVSELMSGVNVPNLNLGGPD